jgi:hypothetical protein
MRSQKEHLVFEGISAQRPSMAENDWLPRSPVFVIDLSSVFGREKHRRQQVLGSRLEVVMSNL